MPDPVHIHNFRRIDPRITTSGQPGEAELAEIARLGVTHVINLGLHSHEKALPDEAATVAGLGMTYIHIPVAFDAPTEQDFADFCVAMAATGAAPVHVHCIVNMRVSAFFVRYAREILGRGDAEARAVMDSIWQPGGVWATFIGDTARAGAAHGPPKSA